MKLSSHRLILRPVTREDILSVHLYASDQESTQFMFWGPNTFSETIKYIENSIELETKPLKTIYRFAITLKKAGDLIGMIDLSLKGEHVAVLGYILNKTYWHQGYTTEASRLMLDFAFKNLGLDKVVATCDIQNTGSYKVMEKIGMRRVGKYSRYNPKYAIDREEYLYEINHH